MKAGDRVIIRASIEALESIYIDLPHSKLLQNHTGTLLRFQPAVYKGAGDVWYVQTDPIPTAAWNGATLFFLPHMLHPLLPPEEGEI